MDALVVENDPRDAELILAALSRAVPRLRAVHVEDAAAASRALDEADALPRFVLLDLGLPGNSALRLLEALRAAPRTRELPVILLASGAAGAAVRRGCEQGANSCVVKPDDPVRCMALLAEVARYWGEVNVAAHRPPRRRR